MVLDKSKQKVHKDLYFLAGLKKQSICNNLQKYMIQQGNKQKIVSNIKSPITLYFSYERFDYEGKWINRVTQQSLNLIQEQQFKMDCIKTQHQFFMVALSSMTLNQKSWFNCKYCLQNQKNCNGYNGYHYEITLDKIKPRNADTILAKKLVYQDNRQIGKQKWQKNKFKEAMKAYRESINILSGLSKKFFKPEEIQQLNQLRIKSEKNYLRCVAKLQGFGGRYDKQIGQFAKKVVQSMQKHCPGDNTFYYLKAGYLKYESKFSDAIQSIQDGLQKLELQKPNKSKQELEVILSEEKSLKLMKNQIKVSKQRNIRHLQRQQIRKLKSLRKNEKIHWDEQEDDFDNDE